MHVTTFCLLIHRNLWLCDVYCLLITFERKVLEECVATRGDN